MLIEEKNKEKDCFKAREDQENAIKAFKTAIDGGKKRLLMYAVMRFGKSFTAMSCANQIENVKLVLIVSAKKDVINEWKNTVENHVDFADYNFLKVTELLDDTDKVSKLLDDNKKVVVCTTLQDLQTPSSEPSVAWRASGATAASVPVVCGAPSLSFHLCLI